MSGDPLEKRLEHQIASFGTMRSPLYERALTRALEDLRSGGVMRRFFDAEPARRAMSTPGVRLLGAFHYLALTGEAPELAAHLPSCGGDSDADLLWEAARALLAERMERVGELFAETPQTNEVLRAVVLSAGLAAFAKSTGLPLRVFEIGASAGLNTRLQPDGVCVAERAACDLHPLDIESERDRVRLLSFVWADDAERIERLHEAIEAARAQPLLVEQADMYEWLTRRVMPKEGYATVVMQSVVEDHLTKDQRLRLAQTIDSIGEAATSQSPFAWLRMERNDGTMRYDTQLQIWPGKHERIVAKSTGHAREIEWFEWSV